MRTTRFHSDLLLLCFAGAGPVRDERPRSIRETTNETATRSARSDADSRTNAEPKSKQPASDLGFLLATDRGFNLTRLP
jgi:hypothetical protein